MTQEDRTAATDAAVTAPDAGTGPSAVSQSAVEARSGSAEAVRKDADDPAAAMDAARTSQEDRTAATAPDDNADGVARSAAEDASSEAAGRKDEVDSAEAAGEDPGDPASSTDAARGTLNDGDAPVPVGRTAPEAVARTASRDRTAPAQATAASGDGTAAPALVVDSVTVKFAGLTALDAVSFTVEPGSVHAIIGPNGAGKSTCFNVLSGVYRATSGSVRLGERDITGLAPHRIAGLGVARTFQNIALPPHATVADSLLLGRHRLTRAGFVATGLRLPSAAREARLHRERVGEIAEFVGLADDLHRPAGALPYGKQKLVELARALCMEPRVLLLDEPIAGMTADERQQSAAVVAGVRDSLGISIVLVEHDMGVVMRLADAVTVLDFGRRIAHGTPAQVQSDPAVVQAYLGTEGTS